MGRMKELDPNVGGRFTETISTGVVIDHMTGIEYQCEMRIDDKLLKLLNKISEENEQLQHQLSQQEMEYATDLHQLAEKNEQLKQRNDNQYNQLTELWKIIEEEDWKKLIAMKKQLKEDEERLQREWGSFE